MLAIKAIPLIEESIYDSIRQVVAKFTTSPPTPSTGTALKSAADSFKDVAKIFTKYIKKQDADSEKGERREKTRRGKAKIQSC